MKICIVAYKFGTEKEIGEHLGTYHYFIEKLRRLRQLGHEVYVIAPWLGFFRRGSTDVGGVKVMRYFPPYRNRPKLLVVNYLLRLWYIRATQKQVLKLDKELPLDVVYVWQARETGFAVAQISDRLRAPFVFRQITAWQWHFERNIPDKKSQIRFARAIYEQAKKVVFVSHAASAESVAMGLSPEKIAIIGIGVDTDIFVPQEKKASRANLLFIGRINFAEKGLGVLLEAMPDVLKKFPDAKLTIVGGGGEIGRVHELARKLNIGSHIEVVGRKPFLELPRYIRPADIFIVPSLWVEHFGQVTVDAMSCGVPVIGTNMGGTPEIITSDTGIVVPSNDSAALAGAVIKLLTDDKLRQRMGRAARERVERNYTYDVLIGKFLELVKDVS